MSSYKLNDFGADVQKAIDDIQSLVQQGGEDARLLTPNDLATINGKQDKPTSVRAAEWPRFKVLTSDNSNIIFGLRVHHGVMSDTDAFYVVNLTGDVSASIIYVRGREDANALFKTCTIEGETSDLFCLAVGYDDAGEFVQFPFEIIQLENILPDIVTIDDKDQVEWTDITSQVVHPYSKPAIGIPESDLDENVQDKLNFWETAIFDNTSTYEQVAEAIQEELICYMQCEITMTIGGNEVMNVVLLPLVSFTADQNNKSCIFSAVFGAGEQQGANPAGVPFIVTYTLQDGVRTTGPVISYLPLKSALEGLPIQKGTAQQGTSAVMTVTDAGYENVASGDSSMAIGKKNNVSGAQASAIGFGNTVSGIYGHAVGRDNSVGGASSAAIGRNISLSQAYEVGVGRNPISLTNSRFLVGIGSASVGKNGFLVLSDGRVFIPGVGGFTGTESEVNQLIGRDVASIITPLIIVGTVSTVDGVNTFIANSGEVDWDTANDAFLAGRRVYCKDGYGNTAEVCGQLAGETTLLFGCELYDEYESGLRASVWIRPM